MAVEADGDLPAPGCAAVGDQGRAVLTDRAYGIVGPARLRASLWVMAETDVILTPDQRVRVFISSTLRQGPPPRSVTTRRRWPPAAAWSRC